MKKIILSIFATCLTLSAFTQVTPSGGLTGTGTPSLVPKWISSKKLGSSTTTTVQLSYLDATSSIQTQLDNKLPTNTEQLLTITSFPQGSLADATTYYWGEIQNLTLVTTQGLAKFSFNKDLTITKIVITARQTINASSENVAIYLRKDLTTDYTLTSTLDLSTVGASSSKTFVYSGLAVPVLAASSYELKIVTPIWVTNPTNSIFSIKIYGY